MREGNGGHARATHHSQFQFELPKGGRISRASWQMVFHVICAHADDDLLWKLNTRRSIPKCFSANRCAPAGSGVA